MNLMSLKNLKFQMLFQTFLKKTNHKKELRGRECALVELSGHSFSKDPP